MDITNPIIQIRSLVYNTRYSVTGELNSISQIEVLYGSKTKAENFLQFYFTWSTEKVVERVMGFGLPALFRYTKYSNLKVHVDATFKITPRPFYQTFIFGIVDAGTDLLIPIFYVLMSCKTEEAYQVVYFYIKMALGKTFVFRI